MQTFLPYPDFAASAEVLDYRRLGKQRVECKQILKALVFGGGWANHPATRMWRGHEQALVYYGMVNVQEWVRRGYVNGMDFVQIAVDWSIPAPGDPDAIPMPPWLGSEPFHRSHQSNLLRKDPHYYRDAFPGVPDDIEYVWPVP